MQYEPTQSFGRLRGFLWPIHGHEHRKLLPMFLLFFLISFVYNVLRCMKVTLVVTAEGSGAEVIPFLKVWAVLPGAILLTYIYTQLSNKLSREQVFYSMILLFLGFFTLFMVVLHPNREALEWTSLAGHFQTEVPWLKGLNGLIAVFRHWHLSLFYVLSELWSAVVLSVLFWGFANEVTSLEEAKRFYAIFALGANSSGIFSGQCAQFLTLKEHQAWLPFGSNAWEQSLVLQLSVVLFMGTLIILLFRFLNQRVLRPGLPVQLEMKDKADKDHKEKLSLLECFRELIKSRYMFYIAILVVAYNIVYNLSDVLWTEQVRLQYPEASEFNAYINKIASITGVFATISALILSGNVIRRYGWKTTALITPLIWLVTSLGFFGCLLFTHSALISDVLAGLLGMPVLTLALIFGSAQICLGRSAKYTVFDESKEIAFIPLPKESQRKGKAVVDGIASRFGKSGGSLIIQLLLLVSGELMLTIPYVALIFAVVLTLWIFAVYRLSNLASHVIDKEIQSQTALFAKGLAKA